MPHANWAHCYDFAYENSFGGFYQKLTELTLATIHNLRPPPCSLVDFGAGTGRLAIPLAQSGYSVTAVEPCPEMVDVLRKKALDAGVPMASRVGRMEDFDEPDRFDVGLCVFTVVLYLLDEASLREGLIRFMRSLRRGGRFLMDIPTREVFRSYRIPTPVLERNVTIIREGDSDIYTYREQIRCRIDGNWQQSEDTFRVRYWPADKVLAQLEEAGAVINGPLTEFRWTGADYYSGTKRG
jgi:SAM-dependent methyltransferase